MDLVEEVKLILIETRTPSEEGIKSSDLTSAEKLLLAENSIFKKIQMMQKAAENLVKKFGFSFVKNNKDTKVRFKELPNITSNNDIKVAFFARLQTGKINLDISYINTFSVFEVKLSTNGKVFLEKTSTSLDKALGN